MCLVVFQKIFRKIFSGVWKMLQGKDKPISTPNKTQIDARRSRSRRAGQTHHDRAVDRNLAKHRAASRDRDRREGEIAISDRDQRRWCLRTAPTGAWCVRTTRTGASSSRERR